MNEPCVCKKRNESLTNFLILYVDDIQYIGKVVPMLQLVKEMLITEVFFKKTWIKHPIYLISIEIDLSGC